MANFLKQQAENQRGQKVPIVLSSLLNTLNLQDYQSFLSWAFQGAEDMQLSLGTKYLTRVYFDTAIAAFGQVSKEQSMMIMVTCLRLAAKFNQKRQNSEELTLQKLQQRLKVKLSSQQINQLEIYVLEALCYRLGYTCPQDYLEIFITQFPFYKDMLRNHLLRFVELGLLHPSACEFTAQEMFYGAVIVFLKATRALVDNRKRKILSEITDCWGRATAAAILITYVLNQAEKEPKGS